jgi:integrase/recombinase XerD
VFPEIPLEISVMDDSPRKSRESSSAETPSASTERTSLGTLPATNASAIRRSVRMAHSGTELPNAPDEPSAQARSDADLVDLWLSEKSEHTRRAYERDLREFIERTDKPIQAVLLEDVQAHKRYLTEKGLKKSTIGRKIATIKSLFTFAYQIGYVTFNVGQAVKQPTARRRLSEKLLSHGEVHRLFAAAAESGAPLRNRAILRLFYASGVRRSELASLQWRDVDARPDLRPARGQVTVFGKGEKERTILLTQSTWQVLSQLRTSERASGRGGSRDPLFWSRQGGALSESAIYRVVKKAAEEAGIDGKSVSPHSFRHAHITHALQNGASLHVVMDTVGHSSMQVTSSYSHARPSESSSDYLND